MATEKYIGEAMLRDAPKKKLSLMIKDGSVTNSKMANNAVGTDNVINGAITEGKMHDSAVSTRTIASNAVTTSKIATQSITEEKLVSNSITSRTIVNNAVTTPKISDGSITTAKIVSNAVTTEKISDSSITTSKIQTGAVKTSSLSNSAVTTEKIMDANITASKLSMDSVVTDKISDKNVTNEKLADNTITSEKIASTLMNLIKAGAGISEELIEEMESYNERLNALESGDMTITVSFTGDTTPIEFTSSATIIRKPVAYNIEVSRADANVSWSIVEAGIEGTNKSGSTNVTFNDVGPHTFTLRVTVNYHGVTRVVTKTLTFNICKKSYIGYSAIDDYEDIFQGESIAEGLNPVVSPNGVNGTRTITNEDTPAYLWIVIPKNGNAALVNSIQQLGTLTVDIPYNTYENDDYTFYRSVTKHNIGEYTFKIA